MSVNLPILPTPRELAQRRAQAYARAVLAAKQVRHFTVIGPRAAAYIGNRYSPTVRYAYNSARRMGLVERLALAFGVAA
jgi:hypothetical protein